MVNNDIVADHATLLFGKINDDKNSCDKKQISRIVNYTPEKFIDKLNQYNWNSRNKNVCEMAVFLDESFKETINSFNKTFYIKNHEDVKWYGTYLYNLKNERNIAHNRAICYNKSADWKVYKQKRNFYVSELRKAEKSDICRSLNNVTGDSKRTWKILKKMLNADKNVEIKIVNDDGERITDVANTLNEFFIDSIVDINQSIPRVQYTEKRKTASETNFVFELTDVIKLKSILLKMNNKNDQFKISVKHFMDGLPVIGEYFVKMVNSSLEGGIFPDIWKKSIVVPVPKVRNASTPVNFRPINNLETPEKILEEIVKEQLLKYLDEADILSKYQSGYRKGFSCETALNFVVSSWKKELDSKNVIAAVFLDLKRAFETVNRGRLLSKLEEIGICGSTKKWFESYLNKRSQVTKVDQVMSLEKGNDFGVPQGSVLGALLFIIYINDIDSVLEHCKIHLFADDTLVYICGKNLELMMEQLNSDMEKLFKWLCVNDLKLNLDKTKCMVFGEKREIQVKINNVEIESVKQYKYLGIIIDDKLKFKENVDYICKKFGMKIGVLARLRRNIDYVTCVNIYKTVTAPNLDYVSTILLNCNEGEFDRLQKMQNKAMRIILRASRLTPIKEMLSVLCFLSVKQRVMYNVMILVYKIKNKLVPQYFDDMFKFVKDVHRYSTRGKNDFRLPAVNKENTKKTLFYRGIEVFNELPVELKSEICLRKFKKELILYVKNKFD